MSLRFGDLFGKKPLKSPVKGDQVVELKQKVAPQALDDVAQLQQVVRDVFSAEMLSVPGALAMQLPPSLKALLTPIPKTTGGRPDPSQVEATVEHVARILHDGAVGESELASVARTRARIDAVLGLKGQVAMLPPLVRERVETLLLLPLQRLNVALSAASADVLKEVAGRDADALKERIASPRPRIDTLDVGAAPFVTHPPSFAPPVRFLIGDLILVPRSDGPPSLGVVVGHDPDGLRVEVQGPNGFGIKKLSAETVASANPFRIGDTFTADGLSMTVTGAGADGTLRILPFDPAHPDHAVMSRGGNYAAELAADLVKQLTMSANALPPPVSTEPAHYARAGGDVVGAYLQNAVESSALFASRFAAHKTPLNGASLSALCIEMHKVACLGTNGDRPYVSGHYSTDEVKPGELRGPGSPRSSRARAAHYTDAITKALGLPLPVDGAVQVRGVDEKHLPMGFVNGMHFYPDGQSLLRYFDSAAQLMETLRKIPVVPPGGRPSAAAVDTIADLYHVLANARPFDQVNNSMFMSQVNVLLQRTGHKPVPHGWLDHLAHRLPADSFREVFKAHLAGKLPTPADLGIEKF